MSIFSIFKKRKNKDRNEVESEIKNAVAYTEPVTEAKAENAPPNKTEDPEVVVFEGTGELTGDEIREKMPFFSEVEVVIGEGYTSIGESAFVLAGVSRVKIPKSVESIKSTALSMCSNLREIIVDEDNPIYKSIDGNLYTKNGETLVKYASGKQEEHFKVPSGVKRIEKGAFAHTIGSGLKGVELSKGVKAVGSFAFYLSPLEYVIIPDTVETMEFCAFDGCRCKIYCEAKEQPSTWHETNKSSWNPENCPVEWGSGKPEGLQ